MTIDVNAIDRFFPHHSGNKHHRLVVRNGRLYFVYKDKITNWEHVQARYFGRGPASMKKIAKYVNENRNYVFPKEYSMAKNRRNLFNELIAKYNGGHRSFKRAQYIDWIDAEGITYFGAADWKRAGVDVKEPPLPHYLKDLSREDCPIWKGKKLLDTHTLVLVPGNLGRGKKTNVQNLYKLRPKYHRENPKVSRRVDGSVNIRKPYWMLVTKEVLPNSLDKELHENVIPQGYRIPTLTELNITMLFQYLKREDRVDNSPLQFSESYSLSLCYDSDGDPMVVGKCGESCFYSYFSNKKGDDFGLIVARNV